MNNDVTKIHNKSNKWGFFFWEREQDHIYRIFTTTYC